jgi:hypothetical protein
MAPIDTSAAARATAAPDAAAAALRLPDADRKRLATLTARAARAGITLHAIDDDAGALLLVASRWALTCKLHSLDEAEAWLNRVAGRAA